MILISICGRGGSKGVPKKNIRPINGKPLIGYTLEIALEFAKRHPAKIAISTDSPEIISVAKDFGIATDYTRPAELANDTAGKIAVFRDLLLYEESLINGQYEYLLDLDITSPLRTLDDLETAFIYFKNNREALNLLSVSPARKNPYFNMVEQKEDGYFKIVKELENNVLSRQKAPTVYEVNASFYIFRRNFFDTDYNSALTPKSLVYSMPNACMDIDDEVEFQIVKYLIENNIVKTK